MQAMIVHWAAQAMRASRNRLSVAFRGHQVLTTSGETDVSPPDLRADVMAGEREVSCNDAHAGTALMARKASHSGTCYACGQKGHVARNCWLSNSEGDEMVQI